MTHVRPPSPATDPAVVRARWVLMGLFGLAGVMVSSWLARLPSVRDALDISPSELGGVLLAAAVGSLLAVAVAGPLVTRWGGRVALVVSTVGFSLAYVLLGVGAAAGQVAVLAAGVFLTGVAFAIGNVPLNVESAAVERRLGRTVLPQFHAVFSVGAVLGSLLGAAMAALDVSLLAQFLGTAVVALVWRLLSIPHVVLDTLPPRERAARAGVEGGAVDAAAVGRGTRGGALRTALGAWRERRTVLIGLVVMSAALSEGSANDWLALAVVDGFGEPESVGALVFGVFVGAMTVVRALGTRLIDRYGRVAVLRASGLVSLAGLLLFGLAPTLPLAGVGVAAWGLGAALAVPIGLAAASDDPLRAAGRVSVVSAFASLSHLAAPPLLGLAAESVGARHALLLITGAMVVSILLSGHVARPAAPGGVPVPSPGRPAGCAEATVPAAAPSVEPAVGLPAEAMGHTGPVADAAPAPAGRARLRHRWAAAGAATRPWRRRAGRGPAAAAHALRHHRAARPHRRPTTVRPDPEVTR